MKLKIIAPDGRVGHVDNEGEVNGQVTVWGDKNIVHVCDVLLNKDLNLVGSLLAGARERYGDDLIITTDKRNELYKASDRYIGEVFIPLLEAEFNYVVELC